MKYAILGAATLGLAAALPGAASARDLCYTMGDTQVYDSETLCVSSALAPQSGNRYDVHSLTDDNTQTAWCEGRQGHGVGETITLDWDGAGPLSGIWITNGYAKSRATWRNNSRVRDLRVTLTTAANIGSGPQSMTVTLADDKSEQTILMPWAHNTPLRVQLTILSVYPGDKYTDTCLSGLWSGFGF